MQAEIRKQEGNIVIDTEELTVNFNLKPFTIEISAGGNILTVAREVSLRREGSPDRAQDREIVERAELMCEKADSLQFKLLTDAGTEVKLIVSRRENGILNFAFSADNSIISFGSRWQLREDDHFYGFGERFGSLDKRGEEVELQVKNGSYPGVTYKPIPFFMTPRGYGIMVVTERRCYCRMGTEDDPEAYSITNVGSDLRIKFIYGPEMKNILQRYMEIVGKPELPAEYFFGPWKSRDWREENQQTVYEDLTVQRDLGIAGTIKLIDAGWETEYHSFVFDKEKYPDYREMIADAGRLGYRIVLWISPWIMAGTGAFDRAADRGYLLKRPDGSTYVTRLGNSPLLRGGVLDFTDPEVREWWQDNLRRVMDLGIAGFKTDFGEQVPADAVFASGKTGREMHNIYPRLYNRLTWEVVKEKDGILLGRSAWHGSQQYPAVWAGDQSPTTAPWSGLPSVINAGLSAGMSGFPYWGSDIGGYFGSPAREVFIRWAQFGALCPIMQIHGTGEHDPWEFDTETLIIYREYARFHTRLLPYIYTYAGEAASSGCPIMRPLALEYQKDNRVHELETAASEYLLGESLLVAPIYYGGDCRILYLPGGQWIDWWTGEELTGPEVIEYTASLKRIPIFIKKGSIIPLYPRGLETVLPVAERDDINNNTRELTLEIYPSGKAEIELQDGFKAVVVNRGNIYEIELNNTDFNRIELKLMNEEKAVIENREGCRIIATGTGYPAVRDIDPARVKHRGFRALIEPSAGINKLQLKGGNVNAAD